MLQNTTLKPITGTFVSPLLGDTGINNWGRQEWEREFRLMKTIGIDTVIIIRCELERGGKCCSALDPRSTTWREDPNLLSMFFRLADEHDMALFLGGTVSLTNLHRGDWKKELDNTRRFYDRMLHIYGDRKCLRGLYCSLEALPWHFHFFEILHGMLEYFREVAPAQKTLSSPSFSGITGDNRKNYTAEEWMDIYGNYFFDSVAGLLDYCAPQDTFTIPECTMGEVNESELCHWYRLAEALFRKNRIELWANIEMFQRPYAESDGAGFFRQIDYRSLYMKLQAASPCAAKLITFEFSSCLSPNAEWGSSRRLLERYLEMTGVARPAESELLA